MNDKELQATREIYNNFEQERNQIGVARKKLYELEQNPLIQEYLKLKKFIEDYQMDKYTEKNVSKHIYEGFRQCKDIMMRYPEYFKKEKE